MEIHKFENGKIEKHFPDGTKEILFNDRNESNKCNDGYDETYFSDGNAEIFGKKRRNIIIEKLSDNEVEEEFD